MKNSDQLLKANLNLARKIAHEAFAKYGPRVPWDELYQLALIGLWKAITRYEPAKGFTLATYAYVLMRGEILHYIRDLAAPVRTPRGEDTYYVWLDAHSVGWGVVEVGEEVDSQLEDLRDLISRLPSDLQAILSLVDGEGLLQREAADRLGISAMTVCRRRQEAIAILKNHYLTCSPS